MTGQDKSPGELMRITEEILTTGGSVDELDRKRIARKQLGKSFHIERELLPHFREMNFFLKYTRGIMRILC
jgi:hypothetical protein